MHFLKSHRSTLLDAFFPFWPPRSPRRTFAPATDAQVFRNGVLPALLLLAAGLSRACRV